MDPGSIVVAALAAAAVAGPVSGSSASAVTRPVPVAAQRLDGLPQRVFDDGLEGDGGGDTLTSGSSSLSALLADRAQARNSGNRTGTGTGAGSGTRSVADRSGSRGVTDDDDELRVGQRGGAVAGTSDADLEELAEQLSAASADNGPAARRLGAALENAGLDGSGAGVADTEQTDTEQTGADEQVGDDELAGRGGQGVDEDLAELLGSRSAGDDVDGRRQLSRDDLADQLDQQDLSGVGSGADALAERRASGGDGRQRELGGDASTATSDDAAVEQIAEDLYEAVAAMQSPSPAAQRLEAALENAGFGGAAAAQTDDDATGLAGQNDVLDRLQGSRSSDADLTDRLRQLAQDDESSVAPPRRSGRSAATSNGSASNGAGSDLASVLAGAGQRSRDQGDLDRRRSITSALERSSSANSGNGPQG